MKNFMQFTMLIPTFLVVACGGSSGSKDPVADLADIRERAKLELKNGPQAPVERIKYVPQEVPVKQEQATLTDGYVKITHDNIISFYEGQSSSYKFTLSVKDPDFTMKLTAKGLPKGAEFKDISTAKVPNTYELRWTPSFNSLPADQTSELKSITLVPVLNTAKDTKKAEIVKGLSLEKVVPFYLNKSQEKPSALTVTGLPTEIQEGQVVPFSVTVKFPGLDDGGASKPYIARFQDNNNQVAGSTLLEMDGSRYVTYDTSRANVEYMGDFKWKFNLVFDTKNNPVEAQKSKDGSLANVNFTQTRLLMRVYGSYNASPETIVRLKINRPAPAAPAAPAAKVEGK